MLVTIFDVKHIFYILLTNNESMSMLFQWSMSMLTLYQGTYCPFRHYVKEVGPCRRYFKVDIVHVDLMSRE